MIDASRLGQIASEVGELQTVVTLDQEAHQLEQVNAEVSIDLFNNFLREIFSWKCACQL
jgi:hypothetical protein